MATDDLYHGTVPPKFLTLQLGDNVAKDEYIVALTITSLEDGAVTIGFTEEEMDEAWRAMQRWYFKVEAKNHERRMNA